MASRIEERTYKVDLRTNPDQTIPAGYRIKYETPRSYSTAGHHRSAAHQPTVYQQANAESSNPYPSSQGAEVGFPERFEDVERYAGAQCRKLGDGLEGLQDDIMRQIYDCRHREISTTPPLALEVDVPPEPRRDRINRRIIWKSPFHDSELNARIQRTVNSAYVKNKYQRFVGGLNRSRHELADRVASSVPRPGEIGHGIGNLTTALRIADPPYPVPARTNLEKFNCLDREILQKRAQDGTENIIDEDDRNRSFIKDSIGIACTGAAEAIESLGRFWLNNFGPITAEPQGEFASVAPYNCSHFHVCNPRCHGNEELAQRQKCIPPATRHTGNTFIDRMNRYLDETIVPRRVYTGALPGPPRSVVADTQPTGHAWIDNLNKLLDDMVADKQEEPVAVEPVESPEEKFEREEEQRLKNTSDWKQKIRCTIHCRNSCKFGKLDCAGLTFQETFLQNRVPVVHVEPSCMDRLSSTLGLRSESKKEKEFYREKFGELYCPAIYNRDRNYCPHCNKNKYTGRQRRDFKCPKLQMPVGIETQEAQKAGQPSFNLRAMA